jgi:hypothetical protein
VGFSKSPKMSIIKFFGPKFYFEKSDSNKFELQGLPELKRASRASRVKTGDAV